MSGYLVELHLNEFRKLWTPKRLEVEAASVKILIYFTNFRPGTPARRQVTLENCVYSGQVGGMIYIERDWTKGQC